jgi:hypothetical protein
MPHVLADSLRGLSGLFNHIEVFVWTAMGVTLLIASRWRAGTVRRDYILAGLVLLAFGASDYFEADNGNEWWRPWWLFLWKAGCVLALVLILINAYFNKPRRTPKRSALSDAAKPPPQPSPGVPEEGAIQP